MRQRHQNTDQLCPVEFMDLSLRLWRLRHGSLFAQPLCYFAKPQNLFFPYPAFKKIVIYYEKDFENERTRALKC